MTTDDRAPTLATLSALGIVDLVDAVRCADDGLPSKPAPDTLLSVCAEVGVSPRATAMVGDTRADLEMARLAHAGAVLGVLSGVGTRGTLEDAADALIASIATLVPAPGIRYP